MNVHGPVHSPNGGYPPLEGNRVGGTSTLRFLPATTRLYDSPMVPSVVAVLLVAAKVWHYWLSFALLIPIVLGIIGMAAMYLVKVVGAKYPRQ